MKPSRVPLVLLLMSAFLACVPLVFAGYDFKWWAVLLPIYIIPLFLVAIFGLAGALGALCGCLSWLLQWLRQTLKS